MKFVRLVVVAAFVSKANDEDEKSARVVSDDILHPIVVVVVAG